MSLCSKSSLGSCKIKHKSNVIYVNEELSYHSMFTEADQDDLVMCALWPSTRDITGNKNARRAGEDVWQPRALGPCGGKSPTLMSGHKK